MSIWRLNLLLLAMLTYAATGLSAAEWVYLDGSSSSDDYGATLNYRWRQIGGTAIELQNADTARPRFLPAVSDKYIFELIVSNGRATSAPATVAIEVEVEKAVSIPVARIAAPEKIKITAPRPSPPEETIAEFEHELTPIRAPKLNAVPKIAGAKTSTRNANPMPKNSVKVKNSPAKNSSAVVDLQMLSNSAPIAAIKNNVIAEVGERVELVGYGTDVDGDKLTYRWRQTGGLPIENFKSDAKNLLFNAAHEGIYLFELVVNDGKVDSEPIAAAVTIVAP